MSWQKRLKAFFINLGLLNEREVTVYIAVLIKRQTVSEITKGLAKGPLALKRTNVYNILNSLQSKGIIYEIPASPTIFAANDPLIYVNSQIKRITSQLRKFEEFAHFINAEVLPHLKEEQKVATRPLKQTFYLKNYLAFKVKFQEFLTQCSYRVLIQAPAVIIKENEKLISQTIERVEKGKLRILKAEELNETKSWVMLVVETQEEKERNSVEFNEFTKRFPYYITIKQGLSSHVCVVLDQASFIFSLQSGKELTGTGLLILDSQIASSYHHQVNHTFKEEYYENSAPSKVEDLPEEFRNNSTLSNGFQKIFNTGFKIDHLHSRPSENYVEMMGPAMDHSPFRQMGIKYSLSKAPTINEEFRSFKRIILYQLNQEQKVMGFKIGTITEDSETLHELKNRELLIQLIEAPQEVVSEEAHHFSLKLCVINYNDRGVLTVWGVEQMVKRVLEMLSVLPSPND